MSNLDLNNSIEKFFGVINDKKLLIGHILFIVNLYLENLDDFGLMIVNKTKEQCLNFFGEWSIMMKDELK
jgi:hypothetical protein